MNGGSTRLFRQRYRRDASIVSTDRSGNGRDYRPAVVIPVFGEHDHYLPTKSCQQLWLHEFSLQQIGLRIPLTAVSQNAQSIFGVRRFVHGKVAVKL